MTGNRIRHKTIGLIGGMSPFSTSEYYLDIVRMHEAQFGDSSYPRILIASVSFQEIIDLQHANDWDSLAKLIQAEFDMLELAGSEVIGLCTNTMHRVLPSIASRMEVVSIQSSIGRSANFRKAKEVGLVGTRFTMSDPIYIASLEAQGLRVVTPPEADQIEIHRIIYDELIRGIIRDSSSDRFEEILMRMIDTGTQAVVLGCTELRLLPLPTELYGRIIDSTAVHARDLWRIACGNLPD